MKKLILQIVAAILGLIIAKRFVHGVDIKIIANQISIFGVQFTNEWQILLLIGIVLGLINFFIKPILNLITFPLKLLTFGIFGLLINMALIEFIDILFPELVIKGFLPLFLTTIIIFGLSSIFSKL